MLCSLGAILVMVPRYHKEGNSYKGQHLIGAGLQVQRFSPLLSKRKIWQCPGRHGAGEVLHLVSKANRRED